MHFTAFAALALGTASLLEAAATPIHHHPLLKRQNGGQQNRGGQNGGGSTCLNDDALQLASSLTGQEPGSAGVNAGQASSKQDSANFINFCSGERLTNGTQFREGSCNGIPMGKIPAVENMISAVILEPQLGQTVPSGQTFNIRVQTQGLDAGSFTNPTLTYYNAPQDLSQNGQIIGHCHVTIQDLGNSLNPTTPPDPTKFSFFKGIDDAGNGQGLLQAEVTGGLVAGFYRVCTLIGASNHQPVIMPVAQRGAQDDCTKFEVVDGGNNNGGGNNGNNGGNNGGDDGADNGADNGGNNGGDNGADNGGNAGGNGNDGGNNNSTETGAVQVTSGTLGGALPTIEASGNADRPFSVNGNTFVNEAAAVQRACDVQLNACSDAVNRGQLSGSTLSDCNQQRSGCRAA